MGVCTDRYYRIVMLKYAAKFDRVQVQRPSIAYLTSCLKKTATYFSLKVLQYRSVHTPMVSDRLSERSSVSSLSKAVSTIAQTVFAGVLQDPSIPLMFFLTSTILNPIPNQFKA